MDEPRECQAPVPRALCGDLRPSTCSLVLGDDGTHAGDHKAHLTIRGVGKVVFRWKPGWGRAKNKNERRALRRQGPPEITLPRPSMPVEKLPMARVQCTCPGWWNSHGHALGCRLTSG